jgi:hypothetical protein
MPREKKRDKSIKDTSVTKLLDEFTDSDASDEELHHTQMTDEEYAEMMVKKELERKLLRARRDSSIVRSLDPPVEECEEIPEIPEGSCPSCYFCTIIRRIGHSVYCVCANTNRVVEGMYFDRRMWVRSEPDLECHKESPMLKAQKQIRQHIEERQLQQVQNEPVAKSQWEKEPIIAEPKLMNLFDEMLELLEDEPEIEDPDIPDVEVHPPSFREKSEEPVLVLVETSVQESLEPIVRNEAVDSFFREETIAVHKHKALRTLEKYKRDKPQESMKPEDGLIVSEKLTPMRKCENCYFCVDTKWVGGSSWCHCTNLARSTDTVIAASWVRSRLNAPCWRRTETF